MQNISRRTFLKTTAALTAALPLASSAKESNSSQSLKFIHITDSHMDLQDSDTVEAMKIAVSFINSNYPDIDFVLFGGDNFNNNVPGDTDAREFKKIVDRLHCPYYAVRGNKESSPTPKGDKIGLEDFKKIFFDKKELHVHGKDWLLQKNGYNILGLDSNIENHNNGKYTSETIAFAKKVLEQKKPTIILNHHPYTNYWRGNDPKDIHKYVLGNAKEVIETLFKKYDNLLLTLSGHKHIDNESILYNTTAITTRGFIRPLDLDQYPMRYVELNGEKITHKLIYTA